MKIIHLFEAVNHDQLLIQFGNKLIQRFQEDRSISDDMDPEQIIKDIDKVNPTNKHEVSQWIVKTYVDGGISLYEDMSRVNYALKEFYKWRNQLEVQNLHSIKDLTTLENMVKPFTDNDIIKKDNHIKSEQERVDFAKSTTDILYDGDDGKIIWPRTKGASCYYGEDTHWCISATRSKNYFNQYTFEEGYNLLFLLPNDGSKWAFLYNNNGKLVEIYDSDDNSMSLDKFMDDSDYKYQDLMAHMPEEFHIDIPEQHDDHKKMKPQDVVYLYYTGKISDEWIETHMSDMSINYQRALIGYKPELIEYINDPSESILLEIVKQDGMNIKYIKEPSLEVQMASVKEDGRAIQHIKEPSLEVQMASVNQNGHAIQHIKEPSLEVQLATIKKHEYAIQYIKDPSLEVQIAAVKKYGRVIKYIKDPSLVVQLAAVKEDGYAIGYIKEPSLEVQLAAVKQDGYAIQFDKAPSLEVQMAAVNQNGYTIEYINNPSLEVQLAAVKQDGYAIKFIKEPYPEVKEYVRNNK